MKKIQTHTKKLWEKSKKFTVKYYNKIKNKIEYGIRHENTRITKQILFTFLFNMLYVLFVSICILLSLRLLGYELNFINLASCIGLYFLLQEVPEYVRKFRQ